MEHHAYAGVTRKSGKRPVWTGHIHLNEEALSIPLRWRAPRKIFVNSMSDLFQDNVPDSFIKRAWTTMEQAHWHVFQVLTKRPENMLRVISENGLPILPNVWLGNRLSLESTKVEFSALRRVPAQIRFVSFEPLLGSIGNANLNGIHWAIVGGKSGPRARAMKHEWVDQIRLLCSEQNVAFFFKQWGGVNKKSAGASSVGRHGTNTQRHNTRRRASKVSRRFPLARIVVQQRRQPALRFFHRPAFAPRIILDLVALDLADAEIAALGMGEIEARDR